MKANSESSNAGGSLGKRHGAVSRAASSTGAIGGLEDDFEHMVPQLDDLLSQDEMEQAGELGGDGDDLDSPEVARLAGLPLSPRQFLLLHRMDQAIKQFKSTFRARRPSFEDEQERVPDEVWRSLGDEALGISSQIDDTASIEQRAAALSQQLDNAKRQLERVRRAASDLARLADELQPVQGA